MRERFWGIPQNNGKHPENTIKQLLVFPDAKIQLLFIDLLVDLV